MMTAMEAKRLSRRINNRSVLTDVSYTELFTPSSQSIKWLNGDNSNLNLLLTSLVQEGLFGDQQVNDHALFHLYDMHADDVHFDYPKVINDRHQNELFEQQYIKFHKKNTAKSYLFSILVSDKFYSVVKTDLIAYARLILKFETRNQWQMKVITTDSAPFKLLNVLLTNSLAPQIIHLGKSLAQSISNLDNYYLNSQNAYWQSPLTYDDCKNIMNAFEQPMYLYEPIPHRQLFQKQLQALNQQDTAPILDRLDAIFAFICDQVMNKQAMLENEEYRIPIDALNLDNLLSQYADYYNPSIKHVYKLDNVDSNKAVKQPEIRHLINYLLEQIAH